MDKAIINYLKNRRIAILGFGREGKSSYDLIRKHLPNKEIVVLDQNPKAINGYHDPHLHLISDSYLAKLDDFELVLKTPGISLIGRKYQTEISSQFDLLTRFTNLKVIGISGTKGKSTTSSLLYEVLKDQNKNSFYVGNIGIPIFTKIEQFKSDSLIVAEISAYQLADLRKSPSIGVLLNLYEEHLDYFKTLTNYYQAKFKMFQFQTVGDYSLYNADCQPLHDLVTKTSLKSHLIPLSKSMIQDNRLLITDKYFYDWNQGQKLIGYYNKINVLFVLKIAAILGLDLPKAEAVIRNFEPLEHRLNLVGVYNGIQFYDDTLATVPEATLNSITALPNLQTIIIGGKDRHINYDNFINQLRNSQLKYIICQPETGFQIYQQLKKGTQKVFYFKTMAAAVRKALVVTEKGQACLLSPAASSYNAYADYLAKSQDYLNCLNKFGTQKATKF